MFLLSYINFFLLGSKWINACTWSDANKSIRLIEYGYTETVAVPVLITKIPLVASRLDTSQHDTHEVSCRDVTKQAESGLLFQDFVTTDFARCTVFYRAARNIAASHFGDSWTINPTPSDFCIRKYSNLSIVSMQWRLNIPPSSVCTGMAL